MRDFFDPTPEVQNVVLSGAATVRKAERLVLACEACSPDDAEIPFDNILDRITGHHPAVTDYILEEPAKCPRCRRAITEKTFVEFSEGGVSQAGSLPAEFIRADMPLRTSASIQELNRVNFTDGTIESGFDAKRVLYFAESFSQISRQTKKIS